MDSANGNSISDGSLVSLLQNGSHVAYKKIFNRYWNQLLFYTTSIVKTERVAKDIVQETFVRLWTKRDVLDPGQSLSGYLHTIARNQALNHLKRAAYDQTLKEQIWQEIDNVLSANYIEENLYAEECTILVQQAVDRLPPQRKRIYQLSRRNGMTHREIGLMMGISKNTVKNQMVSALKEIRSYLKLHADIALAWLIVFCL
jgi:RNA polymerase sigma-70 factor (family 1)